MSAKQDYDAWHSDRAIDPDANEIWHHRIKQFAVPEQDFCSKRVLEIGCGRGGFAIWLARQEFAPKEFVAADYSSTAVARGRELAASLGVKGIIWKEADIEALPFDNASFDTVISCETIEHVPNPKKAIQELARIMRPDGRLFLTTPNYMNLMGLWRCYRYAIGRPYTEAGQPINQFMMLPRTIAWVRQAGIKIERFGSDDLYVPRIHKPPIHLSARYSKSRVGKYLGLQSWIFGRKVEARYSDNRAAFVLF